MKMPTVTYQAPQMKNWRNIMALRRALWPVVFMCMGGSWLRGRAKLGIYRINVYEYFSRIVRPSENGSLGDSISRSMLNPSL